MENELKISVITTTYNSGKTVSDALESVMRQDYPHIEHLIVDGKSTDNTHEVVAQYEGKYPVKWNSEKDKGIYDAFNKGVTLATGDVVGFVHSDDFLAAPEVLSHIADLFKNNAVDGVYGDLQYVSKENTDKVIRYWKSKPFYPNMLSNGWMPAHPTLFLRKEIYDKIGLFNLDYKIAADYELILRVFSDRSLKFEYLPEVITKMRVGGNSNRSLENIKLKSKEDLRALKAHNIKHPYKALMLKNIGKLGQFIKK